MSRTETAVVRSPNWRRWLLITGVFLAGVVGWSAVSSSTPAESDDESAAISGVGDTTAETTEDTSGDSTSTTTRSPGSTALTTSEIELLGDGNPLLDEDVDYELIIGVSGGRPSVLDLDTGELRHSEDGGSFNPLTVSGEWILGRHSDHISALPLSDLGAELTQFSFPGYFDLAAVQKRTDGRVWFQLYDDEPGQPELVLVDIATGDTVEQLTTPDGAFPAFFGLYAGAGPMIFTGLSGGVYESAEDGFTRVADGRLLAADEVRVLVETCDARLQCSKQWLDRRTWQPIELAVPQERIDSGNFVNGTDWLLHFSWTSYGVPGLLNVVSGQEIEVGEFDHGWEAQPAISPDGRWLATVTDIGTASMIQIEELATGATFQFEGVGRPSGALIFIDRRGD